MNDQETSISSVVVIPHRLDRFKYMINFGKLHLCDEVNLKHLLNDVVKDTQKQDIADLLQRLKGFVIMVTKDDEVKILPMSSKDTGNLMKRKLHGSMQKGKTSITRKKTSNFNKSSDKFKIISQKAFTENDI